MGDFQLSPNCRPYRSPNLNPQLRLSSYLNQLTSPQLTSPHLNFPHLTLYLLFTFPYLNSTHLTLPTRSPLVRLEYQEKINLPLSILPYLSLYYLTSAYRPHCEKKKILSRAWIKPINLC